MPKASLLLYNAYYVFNYFRFSASSDSDSAKADAPDHESNDPMERDYAGSDLTAWVYDMFNPELPYSSREDFPDGEGLNRRIGFSDLTEEARDYLVKQKKLSLLNFGVNYPLKKIAFMIIPAILGFSFSRRVQYANQRVPYGT